MSAVPAGAARFPALLRPYRMSGLELANRIVMEEQELPADAVVAAWYGIARDALFHELEEDDAVEVRAVGDCLAPRRAIDAIWDGFRIGCEI